MKGGGGKKKSESVRERTKIRERIRRAISSRIFSGVRRHGGYSFSDGCDTNAVLRRLANEAGFVVEPDGTTYRPKDLIKCPLCGVANAFLNDVNIKTNESSFVPNGVNNSSMTTFPLLGGVKLNSNEDYIGNVVMTNNDHVTNNIRYYSPLSSFDGATLVPVNVCQDHVVVESSGFNREYGFGEYCVSMTMGDGGNSNNMTYAEIQHQDVLHLEEGVNMCNSNHIHNTMVGPIPVSKPWF